MVDVNEYTFFSGGLKGAEAEFGRNAEKWGIKEVNFSFKGHQMDRVKDVRVLTEEELKQGDISMEIVSKRMGRTYAEAEKIRRVIQSIFHMINSGHQVFAVGWIKEDGTVKGGTGWGVELAKLFNRPLSVFDQEKNRWFTWEEGKWVEDTPVISHKTFAGTGTRYLTADGKKAIEDLFERSFGPAK
jgi:hypothetical protein